MRDDLAAWLDIMREAGPRAILADLAALALVLVACLGGTLVLYALVGGG